MVECSFAVVPDETGSPVAVFSQLEDAIDWALTQFGSDRFAIRRCEALQLVNPRPPRASRRPLKATG